VKVSALIEKAGGAFVYQIGSVGVSFLVANVIHYLHQVSVSGLLTTEEFGSFSSLLALLTFLAILAWGLQFALARFVARVSSTDPEGSWEASALRMALGSGLLLGLGTAILFGLLLPILRNSLQIEGLGPILVLEASIPLYFFVSSAWGFLQGRQQFLAFSTAFVAFAIGRFVLGYLLVWGGLRGYRRAFGDHGGVASSCRIQSLRPARLFHVPKERKTRLHCS